MSFWLFAFPPALHPHPPFLLFQSDTVENCSYPHLVKRIKTQEVEKKNLTTQITVYKYCLNTYNAHLKISFKNKPTSLCVVPSSSSNKLHRSSATRNLSLT